MSDQRTLTEEIRNKIWRSKNDLPACLDLLGLMMEKANQRTPETIAQYRNKICHPGFFSSEDLHKINKHLFVSKVDGILKQSTLDWIEKYTVNCHTALSVANFAMTTMIHLRKQIATEKFHADNLHLGGYRKSFEDLFKDSLYSASRDLIIGMLHVFNRDNTVTTQENKKSATKSNKRDISLDDSCQTIPLKKLKLESELFSKN
jgi:hypothetical protein